MIACESKKLPQTHLIYPNTLIAMIACEIKSYHKLISSRYSDCYDGSCENKNLPQTHLIYLTTSDCCDSSCENKNIPQTHLISLL